MKIREMTKKLNMTARPLRKKGGIILESNPRRGEAAVAPQRFSLYLKRGKKNGRPLSKLRKGPSSQQTSTAGRNQAL